MGSVNNLNVPRVSSHQLDDGNMGEYRTATNSEPVSKADNNMSSSSGFMVDGREVSLSFGLTSKPTSHPSDTGFEAYYEFCNEPLVNEFDNSNMCAPSFGYNHMSSTQLRLSMFPSYSAGMPTHAMEDTAVIRGCQTSNSFPGMENGQQRTRQLSNITDQTRHTHGLPEKSDQTSNSPTNMLQSSVGGTPQSYFPQHAIMADMAGDNHDELINPLTTTHDFHQVRKWASNPSSVNRNANELPSHHTSKRHSSPDGALRNRPYASMHKYDGTPSTSTRYHGEGWPTNDVYQQFPGQQSDFHGAQSLSVGQDHPQHLLYGYSNEGGAILEQDSMGTPGRVPGGESMSGNMSNPGSDSVIGPSGLPGSFAQGPFANATVADVAMIAPTTVVANPPVLVLPDGDFALMFESMEEALPHSIHRDRLTIEDDDVHHVKNNWDNHIRKLMRAFVSTDYGGPQSRTEDEPLTEAKIKEWNRWQKKHLKLHRAMLKLFGIGKEIEAHAWLLLTEFVTTHEVGYRLVAFSEDLKLTCGERIKLAITLLEDYSILRCDVFGDMNFSHFVANPQAYLSRKMNNLWINMSKREKQAQASQARGENAADKEESEDSDFPKATSALVRVRRTPQERKVMRAEERARERRAVKFEKTNTGNDNEDRSSSSSQSISSDSRALHPRIISYGSRTPNMSVEHDNRTPKRKWASGQVSPSVPRKTSKVATRKKATSAGDSSDLNSTGDTISEKPCYGLG